MSTVTAVPIPPTRRSILVWIILGVVLALVGSIALARMAPSDPVASFLIKNKRQPGVVQTASGLQYKILSPGKGGAKPTDTDVALVNYEGNLTNGTVFDKSQQPVPMPLAGVVKGFSEGLKLMPKGAKYRFWLKPDIGYGDKAQKNPQTGEEIIPAHSILVFDVELLDFLPESVLRQMQAQQQMQQQQQGGAGGPAGRALPGGPQ